MRLQILILLLVVAFIAAPVSAQSTRPTEPSSLDCPEPFNRGELCDVFEFRRDDPYVDRYIVSLRRPWPLLATGEEVAAVVRAIEGITSDRIFELIFSNFRVQGAVHLRDIASRIRLTFSEMMFVEEYNGDLYSIIIEDLHLEQKFYMKNSTLRRSLLVRHSKFSKDILLHDNDFYDDIIFEDNHVLGNLDIGSGNIFRGQLMLSNVFVDGNLFMDDPEFIDTRLDYDQPTFADIEENDQEIRADERIAENRQKLAEKKYICQCRDRSDGILMNGDANTAKWKQVCEGTAWIPRCPRSEGRIPVLLEFTRVTVGQSLSLSGLGSGTARELFRPPRGFSTGSGEADPLTSMSGVFPLVVLNKITVEGHLYMTDNKIDILYLERSRAANVDISHNYFMWFITFGNEIETFNIGRNTFYEWFYVSNNIIENDFRAEGLIFPAHLPIEPPIPVFNFFL